MSQTNRGKMAAAIQSKFSTDDETPETRTVCCSSCSDGEDNSAAGHYCVECEIYLCSKCLKCHNRIPATKSHQVNDVEYNPQNEKTKPVEQPKNEQPESMKCYVHHGKIIDSYCMDHEELCCGTCTLIKHRACKVEEIAVISRDFKSNPKVKQHKESLSSILNDLNQEIDVRIKNLMSIEQDKINMLESVDTYEDEVVEMVTKLAEMSRKQIRERYEAHKKALDSDVDVLKAAVATTAEHVDKITLSNDEQLFTNIETGKLLMKESEHLLLALSSDWSKREVKFRIENEIKMTFCRRESFGEIENNPILAYEASHCRSLYVPERNHVLDICTLESGDIFIIKNNDNSMNRYSSELKFKEKVDTSQYPVAVCPVSAHEVAVRSSGGQVQIISVQESMKVETLFDVEGGGLGLTYDTTDEEFLVCEKTKISVYSKAGNKLRTHEKTSNGELIFSECRHITIDTETKNIYVTDSKKGMIVLYRSGNIKSSFTGLGVTSSLALCNLPGNIYLVSDTPSKQLVQFNRHGIKIGILIEQVLAKRVVYDRVHNRLIVSGNTVSVYTLSATRNNNVMKY